MENTTPVKILWRIIKENILVNKTSFKKLENLKNDPYREVLELSKSNMFLAFEKFKKITLNKNSKINPRKIRTQFNELIEEVV